MKKGRRLAAAIVLAAATACGTAVSVLYGLAALTQPDWPSSADASGFALLSLVSGLALALGVYAPVTCFAKRRAWLQQGSGAFASIVLNAPAWLALLFGYSRGAFGGITEVIVFGIACFTAGLAFIGIAGGARR